MDWQQQTKKYFLTAFCILAVAIDGMQADTMVTGTVFCDQCKDGQLSMFDYPMSGMKVSVICGSNLGQTTMSREETTNWLGSYTMRFDGTPDLSGCYAQVANGGQGSGGCNAVAGPAQKLRLTFNVFDMAMYNVESLLSQPAQPMSFCPRSASPVPTPVTPPPAFRLPPVPRLPPMPRLPPLPPMPPMPFLDASACSYKSWMMPEYRCYWRAVNPEMKVGVIFGALAGRKYGTDMTLWQSLQGRGDPYRTLLREGTTALLNSYNSLQFPYNTFAVVHHMNMALMGSQRTALLTALHFLRANSGSESATCKFTPCK